MNGLDIAEVFEQRTARLPINDSSQDPGNEHGDDVNIRQNNAERQHYACSCVAC